jgi:hypothetical protein
MADASSQADIRGIDIDKLAKGFSDEVIKLKRFVTQSSTSAREIRWYQKTSGFLDSVDSTGITASQIGNQSFKSRPVVVEQSWTRQTSYVREYIVESPWISNADIKDSDPDILAGNVKDLTRAVEHQVDLRIWNVISNNQSGSASPGINWNATTLPWDTTGFSGCDIIEDIMEGKMNIRHDGYDPEGGVLLVNSYDHKQMLSYLVGYKGSSIPAFSSERIKDGIVMNFLGLNVVVDENVTADYALIIVPDRAATWKSFTPITAVKIEEPLIGVKVRVAEAGECILTDPHACNLIVGTRA